MKSTKQIKLRLETHELKIIRFGRQQKFFCEFCQRETRHLTVSQMAVVLELSEINIFRLAEKRQIHFLETADGKLMLCADSVYTNKITNT